MITAGRLAVDHVNNNTNVLPDAIIRTAMCNMFLWCMNLGLALMLATVCTKTWRIIIPVPHLNFIHFRNPGGQVLTDCNCATANNASYHRQRDMDTS